MPSRRVMRAAALLAASLALPASGHARCGDRAGDLDAVREAVRAAIAACPWATPGESAARRSCLRGSIRHARSHGIRLRSACRHLAFWTAVETPCTEPSRELGGSWELDGVVTENTCGIPAWFSSYIEIARDGTTLTARAGFLLFEGAVDGDRWTLHEIVVFPPLTSCPNDPHQPYEETFFIEGHLPDATGVAMVEQRLIKYPILTPTPKCSGCQVVWQGTLTRIPEPPL